MQKTWSGGVRRVELKRSIVWLLICELVDNHLSLTKADTVFAIGYGHVITVQEDADQVEAAHEIDDLRHALFAECVYSTPKRRRQLEADRGHLPKWRRTRRAARSALLYRAIPNIRERR